MSQFTNEAGEKAQISQIAPFSTFGSILALHGSDIAHPYCGGQSILLSLLILM